MNGPGNGITKLNFGIANAMAANNGAAGLDHFRKTAGENFLKNSEVGILREANQRKRGERTPAHGIDVAERIDRSDLAEGVRVINDGGEEIHGLYQGVVR